MVQDGEARFLAHLDLIDRVILFHCHHNHLSADEADDFAGHVRLKLIEDNYAVLAKFQGRSSMQTFLSVVVKRLLLDYRASRWGKWRPSAEARRAGPLGIELETLLTRDGRTFEEALEILTTGRPHPPSRKDLERIASRLPAKVGRHFEPAEGLVDHPAPDPLPDAALRALEQESESERVSRALADAINQLDTQDRLIIMLHFVDRYSIADIAQALRLEQKALYRRVEKVLAGFRRDLERSGIDKDLALDLFRTSGGLLELKFPDRNGETRAARPSIKSESEVGS